MCYVQNRDQGFMGNLKGSKRKGQALAAVPLPGICLLLILFSELNGNRHPCLFGCSWKSGKST